MPPPRPRVLCNLAPSLDGKIAPARKRAPFVMSRHPEDPARMHALRANADAVIIGASNLRADNPDLLPSRLRVVVTRSGAQISPAARMFDPALGGEAVVMHASSMPESKRAALRARATLVEAGPDAVDVVRLLAWLATERACRVVVCEGGGVLLAAFFEARAVDTAYLTLVPRVLGGADAPTMVEGRGFEPDAIPDGRLASVEQVGDELFLRYDFAWT
ncbi:MAG TPA: dihydrofolate reductase family protein [Polyangiaceae bacterium]|nr:dihydrofolate reductase family protein [Polyangiaceae bacterium]